MTVEKEREKKHDRKNMTVTAFPKLKSCFVEIRRDKLKNIYACLFKKIYCNAPFIAPSFLTS